MNNMNGKLLVVDLDGTLLVSREDGTKDISKRDRERIADFIACGGEMIVATGRLDHDIVKVEEMLNIQGSYRISVNGSSIRSSSNEIVFEKSIPKDLVKTIADYFFARCPRVEFADSHYRYYREPRPVNTVGELVVGREKIFTDLMDRVGSSVFPLALIAFDKEYDFRPIKQYVLDNFSERVDTFMTAPTALEVVAKNVSKGEALRQVMEWKNIAAENVYVIGDSESDMSMYQVTKNSFAMADALEYVRKGSNYVVPTVADCIDVMMGKE